MDSRLREFGVMSSFEGLVTVRQILESWSQSGSANQGTGLQWTLAEESLFAVSWCHRV